MSIQLLILKEGKGVELGGGEREQKGPLFASQAQGSRGEEEGEGT